MDRYFHLICLFGGVEKQEMLENVGLFRDGVPLVIKIADFHTA